MTPDGTDHAAAISKLHPKLRMLANGSTEVNALRAEHAAAVRVSAEVARRVPGPARAVRRAGDRRGARTPRSSPRPLDGAPDAEVSVFLALTGAAAGDRLPRRHRDPRGAADRGAPSPRLASCATRSGSGGRPAAQSNKKKASTWPRSSSASR